MSETKNPIRMGNAVLIRTVTTYVLGRVVEIDRELGMVVLEDAGWVADTGRFGQCLEKGKVNEYERAPDGIASVGLSAIADSFNWAHDLPKTTV